VERKFQKLKQVLRKTINNLSGYCCLLLLTIACGSSQYANSKGCISKKEFYPNGNIKSEKCYINDSIQDGLQKEYYENGQLKAIGICKNGVQDSTWTWYYENGKIEEKTTWRNNKLFGLRLQNYPNGTLNKYKFYDFQGDLAYLRMYNENGSLLKEEGNPLVMVNISNDFNNQVGSRLESEIYVAVPPECQIELSGGVSTMESSLILENIKVKDNVGFYSQTFDKTGNYIWKVKLHLKDLKTQKENDYERKTTLSIVEAKSENSDLAKFKYELLCASAEDVKGDFKKALDHYNKAMEINPQGKCAYLGRGKIYLKLEKYDLACNDFKKAKAQGCEERELDNLIQHCNK